VAQTQSTIADTLMLIGKQQKDLGQIEAAIEELKA
jgi:hypothetical protein